MASAVEAGRAFITLTLNDKALRDGINAAQSKFDKLQAHVRAVATELSIVNSVITAPFKNATTAFADFDSQMRMTAAVTKADAKQFKQLSDAARALGKSTSLGAQSISGGMLSLARMGFNPQEIADAVGVMALLSKATGTELAEAADIAGNALRAFGLDSSNAARVGDVLAATANGSAQTLTDLGEALKSAAPAAHTAGESIEDTNAALAVLANVGIKGSVAGNALKRAYSEIAKPQTQKLLDGIGVKVTDANGNLRKMADILRDTAVAMNTMGSAEKIAFATDVFGERAAGSTLAITADIAKLDAAIQEIRNSQGTLQKVSDTVSRGIGGAIKRLKAEAEDLNIALGSAIEAVLRPCLNIFTQITSVLGQLITNFPVLSQSLAVAVGWFVAVGTGAKALSFAFVLLKNEAITTLVVGLGQGAVALGKLSYALFAANKATVALRYALWGLNAAGKAGLIGLVVAATAAVGVLIYKLSQAARAARELRDIKPANTEQIDNDNASMSRLAEMEGKTLNASELKEAARLIEDLTKKYGNLGIQINAVNRKITGTSQAQARVNKQITEQEIAALEKNIALRKENVKIAGNVRYERFRGDVGYVSVDRYYTADKRKWNNREEAEKAAAELVEKEKALLKAEEQRLNTLKAYMAAINTPLPAAPSPVRTSQRNYMNAERNLDNAATDAQKKEAIQGLMDAYRAISDDIEREYKKAIANGDKALARHLIRQSHIVGNRYDAAIAGYAQNANRPYMQYADKIRNDYMANVAADRQNRTIETAANANDWGKLSEILQDIFKTFQNSIRKYRISLEKYTSPASDKGAILSDTEKATLDALQKEVQASFSNFTSVRDRIRNDYDNYANRQQRASGAIGTFGSIADLRKQLGGSAESDSAKTANAATKSEQHLRKLLEAVQNVNLSL